MGIRIGVVTKDPDDSLTVSIDWTPYLPSGVTLQSYSTVNVPSDLTASSESNDATSSSVVLSGGTKGRDYLVTHRGTYDSGDQRDIETVISIA